MENLLQTLIEEDYGYRSGGGVWGRSGEHDSLVLNEDKQLWFWNSKGIRGNAVDYLVLVRKMSSRSAKDYVNSRNGLILDVREKEDASPPYEKLVDLMWNGGKNKREYWYGRCLTDETIDRFRLGHFDGWNLIPMFEDGVFKNFQCRREVPAKRIKAWYTHVPPILFNSEILPFLKTVYMTEGTVDAILLNQLGLPAISASGTNIWIPEWFSKFSKIHTVYYVEDSDSAGRVASRRITKNLGASRVRIVSYEGHENDKFDTVDFFRAGNKKEDFLECVNSTSKFLFEMEESNGKQYKRKQGYSRS